MDLVLNFVFALPGFNLLTEFTILSDVTKLLNQLFCLTISPVLKLPKVFYCSVKVDSAQRWGNDTFYDPK